MGNNLRKKLLAPLCLTWILLLGVVFYIYHQEHRSFLARETASAQQQAEQYYQQILLTETQTQELLLATLTADHQVQEALRSQNRRQLQDEVQFLLKSSPKTAENTFLHFYNPELEPLTENHTPPHTRGDTPNQLLAKTQKTKKITCGLGLDASSSLSLWTASPCFDHKHSLLGFIVTGKQVSLFPETPEQLHQISTKITQPHLPKLLVTLDKQYINRDNWEKGMRLTGRTPQWDQLPNTVLSNNTLAEKEQAALATIGADTIIAENVVIELADHYYQTAGQTLHDIQDRPIGRIIIFTDIDTNIRRIYRSYYTIIIVFILLGGLLYLLTNLLLHEIEQGLGNSRQLMLAESMDRETSKVQHQQELHNTRQYLQDIIECFNTPLMVVNDDFRITLRNRFLNELLPDANTPDLFCQDVFSTKGTSPAVGEDQSCKDHCSIPHCLIKKVFKTCEPSQDTLQLFTKDGQTLVTQVIAQPIINENGKVKQVVVLFHDQTALQRTDQELQWESTVNKSLAELAETLIEPGISIDEISSLVMDKIKKLTSSQLCFAGYLEDKTNHFICPAMSLGTNDKGQVTEKNVRFEIFRGLWGWVLEHRHPLLSNDPANDSRSTGLADNHVPIKNFLAVPAIIQGELLGEIAVANSDHPYSGRDQQALEQFAILFGIAIQRQRWIEALADAQQEAVEASYSKDQFIANMSHELRTPLNGILGMSNLMLATELTQQQEKYLSMSKVSAEALLRIINDLLDFSKIAANQLQITDVPFGPSQLLREITEIFALDAQAKNIAIKLHIDDNVPQLLYGDAEHLRQILIHLTSNATKFTEKGTITIHVQKQDRFLDGQQRDITKTFLCFTVQDTGIGIAEEKKALLFQDFKQLDGSLTRKFGGTGLGLSFCKKMVELMHGKIWCESVMGKGSAFHCILPFTTPDDNQQSATPKTAESPYTVKPSPATTSAPVSQTPAIRILLAEDDLINREVVIEYLRQKNWQITAVTDGHAAIEAFSKTTFDIILMDVEMPRMDGLETAYKIREIEQRTGNHTPIIALTAHTRQETRDQCLLAGMDDFLSKPLSPESLYGAIENNLKLRQGNTRRNRMPENSSTDNGLPQGNQNTIDLSLMRSALHDNWDLLRKLVNHFREVAPQQIQTLQGAVADNDIKQARETAHTLKGSLANFGARAAMELAAELEAKATAGDLADANTTCKELADAVEAVLASLNDALSRHGD